MMALHQSRSKLLPGSIWAPYPLLEAPIRSDLKPAIQAIDAIMIHDENDQQ
jgi:hypothetical protein